MRLPIRYAITYPERLPSPAPRLGATDIPTLSFEPVDTDCFPALGIGRQAGQHGPRASAALIAADDIAVDRFLGGNLTFTGIADLCADAVARFGHGAAPDLPELLALDAEVRAWAATAAPAQTSRT
jgi:1-deoxy-D-xylulose-5-phosphate reductoisomerase